MKPLTRRLWTAQNRHPDDRLRLFSAMAAAFDASVVLYPGSFVDIAPSFVFDDVTYVDTDARAAKFFADAAGVDEIIAAHRERVASWRFIHGDYTTDLDLPEKAFDLLVSLYAGFVSQHCARFLRSGGWLLVNPSHGDVAMASIAARFELAAVVRSRAGSYTVSGDDLGEYLVPRREEQLTADQIRRRGRGIAYTKPAVAYVFRRR